VSIPFAAGGHPSWPLPGHSARVPPARDFGAPRDGGTRRHTGVDLNVPAGTTVVATESGVIGGRGGRPLGWREGVEALWLRTDSGVWVLYGALEPDSWQRHGVAIGDRVRQGQPIADSGRYPGGTEQVHFETWAPGSTRVHWVAGDPPPVGLLDPRWYVDRARENGHVVEPEVLPPLPTPHPRPRPAPGPELGDGGAVGVLMLGAVGVLLWAASTSSPGHRGLL